MLTAFRTIACCVLAAGILTGCGDDKKSPVSPSPQPSAPQPSFRVEATFEVAAGQSYMAEGGRFSVTFSRVVEDSRCGAAQLCIAGRPSDVTVEIVARDGSSQPQTVTLSTETGRRSTQVGRLTIALENVSPYPIGSPRDIPPGDYRIGLRVTGS